MLVLVSLVAVPFGLPTDEDDSHESQADGEPLGALETFDHRSASQDHQLSGAATIALVIQIRRPPAVIDLEALCNRPLRGGYLIESICLADEPILDVIGRPALGENTVCGLRFRIAMIAGLDDRELSVTLYHEVLEGAFVGCWTQLPAAMLCLNEAGIDAVAYQMHDRYGAASVENLDRMLRDMGF